MRKISLGLRISLKALEPKERGATLPGRRASMEFHIRRELRKELDIDEGLFSLSGNAIFPNFYATRVLAQKLNAGLDALIAPEKFVKAGQLNAMGLIDEILHYVIELFREAKGKDIFGLALKELEAKIGKGKIDSTLLSFIKEFPPLAVYREESKEADWLLGSTDGVQNRELALEELLMLWIANDNPAFAPFARLFDDSELRKDSSYLELVSGLKEFFALQPSFGPDNLPLVDLLKAPAIFSPFSLPGQLEYMRTHWGLILSRYLTRLLSSLDLIREEEKPYFPGPGPTSVYVYSGLEHEYERFTPDSDWMPRVVMLAKSTLVWLSQLSGYYDRSIQRLDQIPDEELDRIANQGFNTLWLIGLWERSSASRRIKEICGNPEAAASAYSLKSYEIANELGGWQALDKLKARASWRGIKIAADMVPNHTGMDSVWMSENPDYFLQLPYTPFPGYSFNGENLSSDPRLGIFLEDHYYSRTDAAVVFKRVDFQTGDTRYIYHGNDGTSMPWNDTGQIDFLNPAAREAVIQTIVNVAKAFPVIRFDAAMILARKHFRRLWYPEPGHGGDIPSRSERALSNEDFSKAMPEEFWREVVDRCAKEAPDCLLLAEAFWMMEGYFVRTLGMHRVYNSAFMNMLKREENAKYRSTIKNTQEFDRDIIKRFVNFMNNPDEETAVAQFGKGDKYFGICTMMVTMPGLPMFGHGQVEGFEEKYGMEYRRAYWKESPDKALVERHEREIFPLMKRRYIFSGSEHFLLYDLFGEDGVVNENVFAYSNRAAGEIGLVMYNNAWERAPGWIRESASYAVKQPDGSKLLEKKSLADAFGLNKDDYHFTFLREQRSGLWFIRSSRELSEKGLFVILEGYQCQVFLDIFEIRDNDRGHYRMLLNELGGRGVPDIQAAILDIVLKDLYAAFNEFLTPSFLEGFKALLLKGFEGRGTKADKRLPSVDTFLKSIESQASRFYKTASAFLSDASVEANIALSDEKSGELREEAIVKAVGQFKSSMSLAIDLAKSFSSAKNATIQNAFFARPEAPYYLAGILALSALEKLIGPSVSTKDTTRLIDFWCLDRKLREVLSSVGVPEDKSQADIASMKAAFCALDSVRPKTRTSEKKKASATDALSIRALVEAFVDEESLRGILGINSFNDILWFNKELFEIFVAEYSYLFAILGQKPPAPKTRERPITKAGRALLAMRTKQLGETRIPKGQSARYEIALAILDATSSAIESSEYQVLKLVEGLARL